MNPAGFTIHSALHMNREDAHCVIHLHTTDGVAVSAQKDGLLPLDQHAMMIWARSPITTMKASRWIWTSASAWWPTSATSM